ncbi:hypothetical protein JCM9492_00250 [Aquifex pyrophilus]
MGVFELLGFFFFLFILGYIFYASGRMTLHFFWEIKRVFGSWFIFPTIVIPAVLSVFLTSLETGAGRWWSNPLFWGWFVVLGTIGTLATWLYVHYRYTGKKGVNLIPEEYMSIEAKPEVFVIKNEEKKEEKLKEKVEDVKEVAEKVAKALSVEEMKKHVIGQEQALEKISYTVRLSVKELERGNEKREKILSSFILVGTTGVGKTETAKAIAKILEPLGYSFLRVDMNQFRDEQSIWTLLGSPRGYLGSEKGGLLPNALKKNPRRVILFDEVEKAHPDVMSFLLQFLDEGYVIERESGNRYDANLSLVFFTSNLYAKEIGELASREEENEVERELLIRRMLEGYFKPEFLGRIDEVVPYKPLSYEDLLLIARKELAKVNAEEKAEELTRKYYELAREYGVRLFLKKIVKEAISN